MAGDELKMIIGMKEDIASIKSILSTMANTNAVALEAMQSAKAAHHRLDRLEKIVYWAGTTIIGAVILGVVSLLWGGKP